MLFFLQSLILYSLIVYFNFDLVCGNTLRASGHLILLGLLNDLLFGCACCYQFLPPHKFQLRVIHDDGGMTEGFQEILHAAFPKIMESLYLELELPASDFHVYLQYSFVVVLVCVRYVWNPNSTNTKPIAGRIRRLRIILKINLTSCSLILMLAKVIAICARANTSMSARQSRNR